MTSGSRSNDDDRTQTGGQISDGPSAVPDPAVDIPNYSILRKLGEGGMGEVYEAQQERPVRRMVAIKLIKLGMDTRRVITRFASERQALALMDHPYIAHVFDAGATAAGRPYFVMEYVDGIPIDEFCARNGLDTRARLELFLQVCEGIQHAHQKGVIHRDIKPSNILVRMEPGGPLPKIIDFGVAKATARSLTELTQFTESGQFIGTPEYMSPEQLAMSTEDIDTRSDVYALGVLLYKLLVGRTPFEVGPQGLDEEVRRTMRDRDPTRPSTRLASMHGDAGPLPSLQPADRSRLARHLRGDLDWITMKALEKDRARRYASVSELAADIQRHLRHQPVMAGPPSATYRLGKFVRRHRVGTAAGALVVLAMLFGTLAASIGMARAWVAERAARQEAQRANAEAEAARQISAFLESLFHVSDPSQARGNVVTAREILDKGALEIRKEFADPLVRARLMDAIGRVYENLGLYARAEPLLREALEIREEKLGAEHPEVAASLISLGGLHDAKGDLEECRRLSERALTIEQKNVGPDHPNVAMTLHNLAKVLGRLGNRPQARAYFERAAQIREKTLGPEDPQLALTLHGLADVLRQDEQYSSALPLYERALAIQQKALPGDHPELAGTLVGLASLMRKMKDRDRARSLYERALSIQEQAYGTEHMDVAITLNALADLMIEQKQYAAARPLLMRSLAIREAVLGPGNSDLARVTWVAAGLHRALGKRDEADALYKRALSILEKSLGPDDPDVAYNRACYAALQGDRSGAIAWLERAIELGYAGDPPAQDDDLKSVHNEPAFKELVAKLQHDR